jgi:alpha-L-arabinofuranosidase
MHQSPPGQAPAPQRVTLSIGRRIGVADPRLFGSFVEHLGRGVYGGIYEPNHSDATPEGFRRDVLDLVTELGVTVIRYPGGNFVSGYDWRDGVGPRDERPRRLDLAWKSIEANEFGTDEFIAWCAAAGVEPMLALNLGLGDVKSALELLEYTNFPGGTTLSDERAANGSPAPHAVRLWCLGNELDGPWQLGHRSAEAYAHTAATTASAMRMLDSTLELVVVGSSNAEMETFGSWEATVLEATIDLVDYISCHIYFYDKGDLGDFLHSAEVLDSFLDSVAATIDHVRTVTRSTRDIRISLDEWNVWNYREYDDLKASRQFELAPPLLEQTYTLADAVVVGTLLQSILRHANVVSIAALAQLVNAIGAIRTEPNGPAWRQTIFHPFAAVAKSANYTVYEVADAPDELPCVVTVSPDGSESRIYVAHRGLEGPADFEVSLAALGPVSVTAASLLWHPDPAATNSAEDPNNVAPRPLAASLIGSRVKAVLPPLSWAEITVRCQPKGE